jgi:hypothetical protein
MKKIITLAVLTSILMLCGVTAAEPTHSTPSSLPMPNYWVKITNEGSSDVVITEKDPRALGDIQTANKSELSSDI